MARSNLNITAPTVFGQNVGNGLGIYIGKVDGNTLQLRTILSSGGTNVSIDGDVIKIHTVETGSMATKDFWQGTQNEYDLLSGTTGYDANTLYFIMAE